MINKALKIACERLLAETDPDGSWRGYLSSSAVSTAVATFALARLRPEAVGEVKLACKWLAANINDDNGWGDTPDSPSNLTATLLTKAALTTQPDLAEVKNAQLASDQWLTAHIGAVSAAHITAGVLQTYGKDRTFSAPILTMCAMAGMLGTEPECWKRVPRLPFEIAALPRGLFRLMNLPVVSYAIPALIAVGLVRFRKTANCWCSFIHNLIIIPTALRRLKRMAPESGGFLEAAPLTGFVAMCLGEAGLTPAPVVQKALNFLQHSIRTDGSWPIDRDLSTWLTSLGSRALSDADALSIETRHGLAEKIRSRQTKQIHPFTGAQPGGWGWTDFSGSVPDGDDTAAALIALAKLEPGTVTDEVIAGLEWLLKLTNRDGGMPTFCRGWGLLPFDCSCPDISAHACKAFQLWHSHVSPQLQRKLNTAIRHLLKFLNKSRDHDQVWKPLWFGDQGAESQANRVYGTAVVLENLAEYAGIDDLTAPALDWLSEARNSDGGWGGEPHSPSIFETTAKAIGALSLYSQTRTLAIEAAETLANNIIKADGNIKSSPIGLYFASLWYDERLYPLLFAIPALSRSSSVAIKTNMIFISHRGESMNAPENTIEAFQLAWERDSDGIEGDFHLLKDGDIVCMHDENTLRTTGEDNELSQLNKAQVKKFDAGSWKGKQWSGVQVPMLDEVLATVPAGKLIYIELKNISNTKLMQLKAMIRSQGINFTQVIIISFNDDTIKAAKEIIPESKALLVSSLDYQEDVGFTPSLAELKLRLKQINADGLDCKALKEIDTDFVESIKAAGYEFHVWTIDDIELAQQFVKLKVDSITSNCAVKLKKYFM